MKPHLSTRAPAVVDGLLAIFAARTNLAEVQILDGPVLSVDELEPDSIAVAPGTPDQPGFLSTFEPQTSLGRVTYVEQVEVTVAIASYSGETDMKPRRDRCAALLAELQAALVDNQTRDGAWDSVELGPEAVWHPVQSPQGATCAVGITIVARAII